MSWGVRIVNLALEKLLKCICLPRHFRLFFNLVDKFKSFLKPFSMGNYADLLDFPFPGRFTWETEGTFFCVKFLPKKYGSCYWKKELINNENILDELTEIQ